MKTEKDIRRRSDRYREELQRTMAEKERLGENCSGELDLRILALVHKLETLFWVLELELPKKTRLPVFH